MDIKKKYKRRRLINAVIDAVLFVIYLTIVQNNPAHKWLYLVAGAIVFALIEEVIKRALKIDELKYYMKKETEE